MAVPSNPSAAMPASSQPAPDAVATAARASISNTSWPIIRRRRSSRSPSGTTSSNATAQPICVAVTTMPTAASSSPNSRPIASSKGCA